MVVCLQQSANDLHMVQPMPLSPHHMCFIKIQIGLTFLMPACPGKEAVKQVSVWPSLWHTSSGSAERHKTEPLGTIICNEEDIGA